ncbi:MAG: D-alanyl-D-alanine carboxypeptidase family protein [Chlamydiales bacterium]
MRLLRLFFLVFFAPYLAWAQPLKVDVSAVSAVLINGETGEVLFEKNAHKFCFPASTTKLATALFALSEKGEMLDEKVTASAEALGCVAPQIRRTKHPSHRLEFGGSHMGIKVGEVLPLRDLLYGLMLISANDAANVIAEHVSGSVPAFMEKLNQFLHAHGIRETHFSNPHGLPCKHHKTTAFDLAQMARLGMRIPTFRQVVKSVRYTKPASNKQPETVFVQTNALLKAGPHFYPKALGVKTGYTVSAGQNLVAAAADDSRFLIAVVLGCTDYHQRYKDVISLFEAGFNEQKVSRTVLAKGFDLFTLKVRGAKTPLQAALNEDFVFNYFPSEEKAFKAVVHWKEQALPIAQGALVGEVRLISVEGERVLKTAPLYATQLVEVTSLHKFFRILHQIKIVLAHKVSLLVIVSAFGTGLIFLFYRYSMKKQKKLL